MADCKHDLPIEWCATCSGFNDRKQEQAEIDAETVNNFLRWGNG